MSGEINQLNKVIKTVYNPTFILWDKIARPHESLSGYFSR